MSDWNAAIEEIEKTLLHKLCKDPACPRDHILLDKLAKLKRPAEQDGGWSEDKKEKFAKRLIKAHDNFSALNGVNNDDLSAVITAAEFFNPKLADEQK